MKFLKSALFAIGAMAMLPFADGLVWACPYGACVLPIYPFLELLAAYLGLAIDILPDLAWAAWLYAVTYYNLVISLTFTLLPIYLDIADAALDLSIEELSATIEFLGPWFDAIEQEYESIIANWTDIILNDEVSGFGAVYSVPPPEGGPGRKLDGSDNIAIAFNFTGLPANCEDCWISVTEAGACIADWIMEAEGLWALMNTTADGASAGIMTFDDTIDENLAPEDLDGATIVLGFGNGTAFSCGWLEAAAVTPPPGETESPTITPSPTDMNDVPGPGETNSPTITPSPTDMGETNSPTITPSPTDMNDVPGPGETNSPTITPSPTDMNDMPSADGTPTAPEPTPAPTSGAVSLAGYFVPGAAAVATSFWMIA